MFSPTCRIGLSMIMWVFVGAGCASYPVRVELEDRSTLPADGVTHLYVDTRNGAIDVRCEETADQIMVHAVRSAHGKTDQDARECAEKIEIDVGPDPTDSHIIRIASRWPASHAGRSPGARFTIVMPPKADLTLNTRNGPVLTSGCHQDVHISTANGRIEVRDCHGNLFADTSNGNITATDISGDIQVDTSNGNIDLERVGKQRIKADSSNGRIRIVDAAGAATLRTSNGSVELKCRRIPGDSDIQIVTSNGNVQIDLPQDVSAMLDLQASNGRVKADLHGVQVAEMESSRSALRARLNSGGGRIGVRTSNGSVTLRTVSESAPTDNKQTH